VVLWKLWRLRVKVEACRSFWQGQLLHCTVKSFFDSSAVKGLKMHERDFLSGCQLLWMIGPCSLHCAVMSHAFYMTGLCHHLHSKRDAQQTFRMQLKASFTNIRQQWNLCIRVGNHPHCNIILSIQQWRQCTYDVTLWSDRVTIVAVETQQCTLFHIVSWTVRFWGKMFLNTECENVFTWISRYSCRILR
jgi:hypothetical protein